MQKSAIGRKRMKNGFTQVSNSMLEDNRLSWRAKGLLSYMLSRPNNWRVNKKDLLNRAIEGRDAIQNALNELKKFGYLHIYPTKKDDGQLVGWIWEYDDESFVPEELKNRTTENQHQMDEEEMKFSFTENQQESEQLMLETRRTENPSFGKTVVRETRAYNNTNINNTNNNNTKDKENKDNKDIKKSIKNFDSILEEEFEKLWKLYPRKMGKANALKSYIRARRKLKVSYETVEIGLYSYIDYLKAQGTEEQFIMHGSTWFNQQKWLDEYISIAPQKKIKNFADYYQSQFGGDRNEFTRDGQIIDHDPILIPESAEKFGGL